MRYQLNLYLPSENDETFFKEFIKNFYNRIINTDSFDDFENLSIKWIKVTLECNDVNVETFLESIQDHRIGFSSLIRFFYQHGIGCNVNKDKALEMYLLAIKQDKVQTINSTIAKYLLSFFYYKDIILVNKLSIDLSINNPLKNEIIISQFTNFNESNTNIIKDDEKKELQVDSNDSENYNQKNINNTLDFNCQDETKINPDEKITFEQYIISERRGNIIAQYNLGYCYRYGKGVSKDEKKAFEWYLKSAEAGNSDAQCNLGYCYDYGIGIDKDKKKAFEWYLKSAKNGNSLGQCNLGYCYEHEIGINKDEEKAFEWYLKSAEAGNNTAQNNLGHCYQHGEGINKDVKKAFEWYLESAKNGNSLGQCNLGYCYEYEIGINKDDEKAFEWYLKSAEAGNITAQYNLGRCYQYGKGINKDEKKAFDWYLKSAEAGNND